MRALWCHLQSHYFKSTKAPQCHQYKEQTHPLTSSFVPLSPNSNSPAESPYTVKGELQRAVQSGILEFLPTSTHYVHHCNNDKLSLSLFSLTDMKETALTHEFVCTKNAPCVRMSEFVCNCVHAFEWKVVVQWESHDYSAASRLHSQKPPLEILTSREWCDETRR